MTESDPGATERDAAASIESELEGEGFADPRVVGRGGFGTVYRVEQVSLHRTVAIKVIQSEVDLDDRDRFVREQHAMGVLSGHPHIVTILQSGITPSGRPYLVMPFHARGSLDSRLHNDGPVDWRTAVTIGIKVAGALEVAHRAGILHRDVKPANILLTDYAEPALSDFGIARVEGSFETSRSVITGSPAFSAPEVLQGQPPTVASDVYSLGATLFALVTGHAAFERRAGEYVVTQFLRIARDPVPDLRETLPEDLCAAIEHAMARDPGDRPDTATDFGEELRRIQHRRALPVDSMALPGDRTSVCRVRVWTRTSGPCTGRAMRDGYRSGTLREAGCHPAPRPSIGRRPRSAHWLSGLG